LVTGEGKRKEGLKIIGKNGSVWGKGKLEDHGNLERVKRDLELLGPDENVALDRRKWRKIIPSPA